MGAFVTSNTTRTPRGWSVVVNSARVAEVRTMVPRIDARLVDIPVTGSVVKSGNTTDASVTQLSPSNIAYFTPQWM